MIGIVIGSIIGAALLALIGALFLMVAARLVGDRKPGYGESYVAMFWAYLANAVVQVMLGLAFAEAQGELWLSGVSMIAGFLVLTYILGSKLEMTLGRAALTSLVLNGLYLLVGIVLAGGLLAAGAAAGAAGG